MFHREILAVIFVLALSVAACGIGSGPTPTSAPVPVPDEVPLPEAANVSGSWIGSMYDAVQNSTFSMAMEIAQASDQTITGTAIITSPERSETYDLTGAFDGTTLRLTELNGRYFTAVLSGETLTGTISWEGYDNPTNAWGQFTVSRGTAGGASGGLSPSSDVSGEWTGNMNDLASGSNCSMGLILDQGPDEYVTGHVHFTCPTTDELYDLTGSFDGTTLKLLDMNNRYFTATRSDDTLTGYVTWGVFDDPTSAWGQYTLTRVSTP